MANCQLRIGLMILLASQIFLGYNRMFNTDEFHNYITKTANPHKTENFFHDLLFKGKDMTTKDCEEVWAVDIFCEFVVPALLLLTGWRIWTFFVVAHYLIFPTFVYNTFGETREEFQEIMRIMLFLQFLGVLFYIFNVKKKAVSIVPPNHP
ncbi:unnamed protein product [Moneuplotes crassus]|uniref:Uncharacterized protein n=2 Tax=Euplotes crassus TaxID=5936 RepID=A0AAD2D7W3_EUPCR|nr:unnamed protein product [Moneuplotes crassus]